MGNSQKKTDALAFVRFADDRFTLTMRNPHWRSEGAAADLLERAIRRARAAGVSTRRLSRETGLRPRTIRAIVRNA